MVKKWLIKVGSKYIYRSSEVQEEISNLLADLLLLLLLF